MRLGGRQIDDQVEFGRSLDRNVPRHCPRRILSRQLAARPNKSGKSVHRDYAARFNDLPSAMHCRQPCSERPGVNAIPVRDYERVIDDVKCIRATIERFEGGRWREHHLAAAVRPPPGPRVRQLLPTTQRKFTRSPVRRRRWPCISNGNEQPARATFRRTAPMSAYPPISTRV